MTQEVGPLLDVPSSKPDEDAEKKRLSWFERLHRWRERYQDIMQPTVDLAIGTIPKTSQPSHFPFRTPVSPSANALVLEQIALPSRLSPSLSNHAMLESFCSIERRLREGLANEALHALRTSLITGAALFQGRRDMSGQKANTRAKGFFDRQNRAKLAAARLYRNSRESLVALGLKEDDKIYRKLADGDIRAFTVYEQDQKLGHSKVKVSWIWGDFDFTEGQEDGPLKRYCGEGTCKLTTISLGDLLKSIDQVLRAYWFRTSAMKSRWEEEVLLLEEEMRRVKRSFAHYTQQWLERANILDLTEKRGPAAYARRYDFIMG